MQNPNMNMQNFQNMQMMQNMMQNMTNNFMNSNSKMIFDPTKIDKQYKKTLISQTITQTKAGLYKTLLQWKSIAFPHMQNFNPGIPTSTCETEVIYAHALEVVEQYSEKGLIYTNNNNMNPVVLHVVSKGFTGLNLEANDDVKDDMIMIRTTYCNTCGHGSGSHYPLQDQNCIYAKSVTIVRPQYPSTFLAPQQTYRTSMITTACVKVNTLLKDDKMTMKDFTDTCVTIETVFQTAIARGHPILILTPFGHDEEDNNPILDIIKIYNYCIYKYGHWFKKIIVAIPQYCPKSMFELYQQNIINPKDIVLEIEDECEADEMRQNLIAKSNCNKQLESQLLNPDQQSQMLQMNGQMNGQPNQMFNMTPEQMQLMMNIMNMNMQNQQK